MAVQLRINDLWMIAMDHYTNWSEENWLKLWTKFPRAYEVTFNGSIVDAVSKSIRHKFAINTIKISLTPFFCERRSHSPSKINIKSWYYFRFWSKKDPEITSVTFRKTLQLWSLTIKFIGREDGDLPLKVVCICRFLLIAMMVKRFPIVPFWDSNRFDLPKSISFWHDEIYFHLFPIRKTNKRRQFCQTRHFTYPSYPNHLK